MITAFTFLGGIVVGVVYEKSFRAWKNKIERAAHAASDALKD